MELIVAEKPKVTQKIAMAIGGNVTRKVKGNVSYYEVEKDGKQIVVAPAVGHIYTLAQKDGSRGYPVFDIEWVPSYKASKGVIYTKWLWRWIMAVINCIPESVFKRLNM